MISVESVQLYNGSDTNERSIYILSSQETKNTFAKTQLHRITYYQGLSAAEIQTLWKTALQVCGWAGTWTEILFVSKLSRQKTGSRIYTQRLYRTGRKISFKPKKGTTNPGRDQQHQPGDYQAQGTIIEKTNGYHTLQLYRYKSNWLPGCKHAFRFPKGKSNTGGKR